MKIRIVWIWIALVSVGYAGCSDMNDLHDKYRERGEAIYVGQVDSVKLFSGNKRVKISYRNYDPKVSRLMVYWDFRQGSKPFEVLAENLGKEVDLFIEDLEEKNYTFELVTSNATGEYLSIPQYVSGPVYGPRYKSTLTNRKMGSATHYFPSSNERMEISWARAIENMVRVEVLYRNESDEATVKKVANDETKVVITGLGAGDVTYQTLYLPEKACIDTFYTTASSFIFKTEIEYDKFNRLLFKRWNPVDIPYTSLGSQGWENIESIWDGGLSNAAPGFMSNGRNVAVSPWDVTFDMGQLGRVFKMKLYPREAANQLYVQSHPKKITIWGSPTDEVTDDFATWLYLGEFNSVRPSGNTTGPPNGANVPAADLAHCRAGEDFEATHNTDVPVRYIRLQVVETWVMPSSNVAIMELEFFGLISK